MSQRKFSLAPLLLVAALLGLAAPPAWAAPVRPGIDVLLGDRADLVVGKRVGLVTNMSAVDSRGRSDIDRLATMPGVKLVALFAPEHGLRADLDIENIPNARDPRTGVPVFSLYGKHRAPTPEQLAKIDVLVFDIQDVGSRFYTYSTTLGLCLEAAAKAGKRVVVPDRPNPIAGMAEGEVLAPEMRHFTGRYPLSIRHGMTIGELARFIDGEEHLRTDLVVVPMEGWRRGMYFSETGLPWRRPSPAMGDPETAIYYVGFGLFEGTNVNCRAVGRPFRWVGAKWANGQALAAIATAANIPGFQFKAERIGKEDGVAILLTDRHAARPIEAAAVLMQAFHALHPKKFEAYRSGLGHMTGSDALWQTLHDGSDMGALFTRYNQAAEGYDARRKPYLLYP